MDRANKTLTDEGPIGELPTPDSPAPAPSNRREYMRKYMRGVRARLAAQRAARAARKAARAASAPAPSPQPEPSSAAQNGPQDTVAATTEPPSALGQPGSPANHDAASGQSGQPGARSRETPWLESTDGPVLQTELQPLRTCPTCNVPVPLESRACPRCGKYAPANKSTGKRLRKHDVEKLLHDILADYAPTTTLQRHACQHLALTLAELKALRPGTTDHQRSLQALQVISATLEASRSTRSTPALAVDVASMTPAELRAHLVGLRASLTSMIASLADDDDEPHATPDMHVGSPEQIGAHDMVFPEPPAPAPEPARCSYCHQLPSVCESIRTERPEIFETLHYDSPEMQKKRADIATQTMLATMRHGSGFTQW